MKYMLLIYQTEGVLDQTGMEACYSESAQLAQALHQDGKYLAANPLHPVSSALSVKVREGKATVTDGPFAENREQLGGYFLIDADSIEEAAAIAARIPGAQVGTVEVRPVLEVPGLPGDDRAKDVKATGKADGLERTLERIKSEYADLIDSYARDLLAVEERGEADDWVDREPVLSDVQDQYGEDFAHLVLLRAREINPNTGI